MGSNCHTRWLLRDRKSAKCVAAGPMSPVYAGPGNEVRCSSMPALLSFGAVTGGAFIDRFMVS